MTKPINGISEIISSYSCVLLDQFGVIHDGRTVYPLASYAMEQLAANNVRIIILSNSSREAPHSLRKLTRMGIDTSLIAGVVTSGDLAMHHVKAYASVNPTARALHFNWRSSRASSRAGVSLFDHGITHIAEHTRTLGTTRVPAIDDIDVIVAHGVNGLTQPDGTVAEISLDDALALLREIGAKRPDVPFFVANPDIVTVDGAELRPMPGRLALEFERAGGRDVRRLGKPDAVAYVEAVRLADVDRADMLAVGDSVGHDILGAANAGVDSL